MGGLNTILPRLINTLVSPRVAMIPKVFQRGTYRHGEANPPGLEGGMPAWVYAEFALQAQETQDTTYPVPAGFNLLSFSAFCIDGSTPPVEEPFRVQLYDVNRQLDFIPGKAVNGGEIAGNRGRQFFLTEPHFFSGSEPQAQLRVSNMAIVAVTLQFALYGIQGVIPQ